MISADALRSTLINLDGRGYRAYKDLQGQSIAYERFELRVDHVQGDPFAAPSRLRAVIPLTETGLPDSALASSARRRACRDFLARMFRAAAADESDLSIDAGGQTVLDRTACLLGANSLELRFRAELPGRGRRILGRRAAELLCATLVQIIDHTVGRHHLDLDHLEQHCATVEDQVALRSQLADNGLVAFVADGSVLPRVSGIDDRPARDAVAISAPDSLRVTLQAPNHGPITGLGIRRGITLIVGGGFHGKSTLLKAIEAGIDDHRSGDGRHLVVSDPTAVKIRAEDGRSVAGVDISSFIGELPGGRRTESFTTDLASGSTSQAAALVEALESGAQALLLDEDTSATNFMIRDERMQALVNREEEPITPFIDRVRELRDTLGVSTVLVMGGSGDYLDHADTVIQMQAYRPLDVTLRAHEVATTHTTGRREENTVALVAASPRRLDTGSIRPERKPGRVKVQARGRDTLVLGRSEIDLRAVEQLVHASQLRCIGWLLARLALRDDSTIDPLATLSLELERLRSGDWDSLTGHPDGDLSLPRLAEVMAALSRLRGVRME